MKLNKFNNLKVNPGAKSSRFVVDLKRDLTAAETEEIKNKKNPISESRLEKLAELDYGKMLKTGGERAKKNFGAIMDQAVGMAKKMAGLKKVGLAMTKETLVTIKSGMAMPGRAYAKAGRQIKNNRINENGKKKILLTPDSMAGKLLGELDQLAFVGLAKLLYAVVKKIIGWLYKACYAIGWAIMFILRLVYFIFLAIARPIVKVLNFIASRLRPIVARSAKILSGDYRKTRAAASAMMAKFFAWPKDIFWKFDDKKEETPLIPPLSGGLKGYLKPVLAFAGVLLIMVLPLKGWTYYKTINTAKGQVLGASESAMNNLISGGQAAANFDFSQADKSFTAASDNFLAAENQLNEINGLLFTLGSIIPDKNIQLAAAGKNIVRAGALSAAAGKNLSLAFSSLFNYQSAGSDEILLNLTVYGHKAMVNLADLDKELAQIDSEAIPAIYQKQFILLKQKTAELSSGLSQFIGLTDQLESFLGTGAAKRYLLVFQNNSELRASGGFIGSFAVMDLLNGKIKNIEVPGGGSYDTDAGLLKKIKAPEPLRLVRPDWHFWDANWWPDWRLSARKLAWFYENSDGSTVDGVISFTPTVMERILKVMGPIDLKEKYGVVIDSDNFWLTTQEFAEQKPNVTLKPKKIIGDLMDKIVTELPKRLNKDNLLPLLKAIEESLSDKNILFYFTDDKLQAEAETMGWSGEMKDTAGDYLSVIDTNIAGGKSDRTIKQEILHQAEVQSDGTIINNLTIRRTHEAIKRQPFSGVRNVNWLRIYVPLGSKLISAEGFKPVDKIFFKEAEAGWSDDPDIARGEALAITDESSGTKIYDELGKTVFANWSQLDPGETIEINIKYELPFKLTDKQTAPIQGFKDQLITTAGSVINPDRKNLYSYSFLAQKQPGMNSSVITSELKLSENFQPIWQSPADLTVNQSGWFRTEIFNQDKLMAVIVE